MKKGVKYYLCILGSELMWPALALKWDQGLYSFNGADEESPVLVTTDYYLTVHRVMDSIEQQNLKCHLLVVNGHGINVWCGSRGGHVTTDSILEAIESNDLATKITHRRLILPQLIASSVSKLELADNGWRAVFGPVEIGDVGEFIEKGMTKTHEQSIVDFDLHHRMEENLGHLVFETFLFLIMTPIFWLLSFLGGPLIDWFNFWFLNLPLFIIGAYIIGTFIAIAHPIIPTTSGLVRGIITGLLALVTWKLYLFLTLGGSLTWLDTTGLAILGLSLFIGFNWGGATPDLSESQMIRDIAVGLTLLVILFALGFYFPNGIF